MILDSSEDADLGSSLPSNFDIIPSNDIGDYVEERLISNVWPCHSWEGMQDRRDFIGRDDVFEEIDKSFFPTVS